jgi:hypothetical protein
MHFLKKGKKKKTLFKVWDANALPSMHLPYLLNPLDAHDQQCVLFIQIANMSILANYDITGGIIITLWQTFRMDF